MTDRATIEGYWKLARRRKPAEGRRLPCPSCVFDMRYAVKELRVRPDKLDKFFNKVDKGGCFIPAKIDQAGIGSMSLRLPAVFRQKKPGIGAPALICAAQPEEHSAKASVKGGDGYRIIEPGADVGNSHFQGRKAVRWAQVPPDLGGIFNHARSRQYVDSVLILIVTLEFWRQSCTRQLVENRQPI